MITNRTTEPRCATCNAVVLRVGTSCNVCDTDTHFEGASRTAPSIESQTTQSTHTLSRADRTWRHTA